METVTTVLFVTLAVAVGLLAVLWVLAQILTGLGAAIEILVTVITGRPGVPPGHGKGM